MKTIKTNIVLKTFNGEPIKDGNEDYTLGKAIANILGGNKTSNPTLAWQLGKKFATEKTVDLKAEDIVFLKKEIEASTAFSIVSGQLIELLDSKDEK